MSLTASPAQASGDAPSSSSSSSSSFKPIPLTAPAGGLTILKPQQTETSFFKIASGQSITFEWNMTSVLATPTHLTVQAVCDNGNTYPVGPTDGIIPGTATQVVWDIWSFQLANEATPLAQASYTLQIWDDRGPNAPFRPGFMEENSALRFAMYTPQPYTPLSDGWTCTACTSGAMAFAAHPAFVSLAVTIFISLFSGIHLLREAAR